MAIHKTNPTNNAKKFNLNMLFNNMSSGKEQPAPAIKKLIITPSLMPTPSNATPIGIIASTLT